VVGGLGSLSGAVAGVIVITAFGEVLRNLERGLDLGPFTLGAHPGTPGQIIVFYDDTPLPELSSAGVIDLVESRGVERGGLDYQYQIYSAAP